MSFGQRLGIRFGGKRRGPAVAATAGSTRTNFTSFGTFPDLHYHPHTETTTLVGGRISGANAVASKTVGGKVIPALTPSATGPKEETDLRGIKRWRLEATAAGASTQFLEVLPADFAIEIRQYTVFIIGRVHRNASPGAIFRPAYASDGVTLQGATTAFRNLNSSSIAGYLYNGGTAASASTANKEKLSVGSGLSCFGMVSRNVSSTDGTYFFVNGEMSSALAWNSVVTTGLLGARIGEGCAMDIYEIAVFKGNLTTVQAQAISDAMMANWNGTATGTARLIQPATQNLFVEGDSITQGVTEVISGTSLAMQMTEPGLGLIPPNVRVINFGVSGATVTSCVTRRDATNGWPSLKIGTLAADNILALQIGRNDGTDAALIYTNIKDYWNNATGGVAAVRGWKPVQMANIKCDTGTVSSTLYSSIKTNFATDVVGGTVVDLQAIQDGAILPFANATTSDGTYYQDNDGTLDTTHPSEYGTKIMATGGDTPQHGYASIL